MLVFEELTHHKKGDEFFCNEYAKHYSDIKSLTKYSSALTVINWLKIIVTISATSVFVATATLIMILMIPRL